MKNPDPHAATCPGCGRPVNECQADDVDESFPAPSAVKGSDRCLVCNRPRSEHVNGQLCTRWVKP